MALNNEWITFVSHYVITILTVMKFLSRRPFFFANVSDEQASAGAAYNNHLVSNYQQD
jgi:hypothetical protein